jgi:hypothetical protein
MSHRFVFKTKKTQLLAGLKKEKTFKTQKTINKPTK